MRFNRNYILAVSLPLLLLAGYWGLAKKNIFTFSPAGNNNESAKETKNQPSRNLSFIDTPKIVKGVYLTSWSAGTKKRVDEVISMSKNYGINAVVIDIKDFSGYLAYDTGLQEVKKYKAFEIKIPDIEGLINKLHSENIYTIARITVFQDPIAAKTRPEWAVKRKSTGSLWLDKKGLAWIDPANKDYWNYIVDISKDAHSRGFDELNFDYVRFPSDGNLADMQFSSWDQKTPKHEIIRDFFKYLRDNLADTKISVDLFGLATVQKDDLGIGQIIEDAYENFDYVSPMVYPSHYASGFIGYKNPAKYPYEVIKYSLDSGIKKLNVLDQKLNYVSTSPSAVSSGPNGSTQVTSSTASSSVNSALPAKKLGKLRPWIQDFDLGADYNAQMVGLEIKAARDALGDKFVGFLLWSPSNIYTIEALH